MCPWHCACTFISVEAPLMMESWQGTCEAIMKMLSDALNGHMSGDNDVPLVLSCGGLYLRQRGQIPPHLRQWRQMLSLPYLQLSYAVRLRRPTPLKIFRQVLQRESLN